MGDLQKKKTTLREPKIRFKKKKKRLEKNLMKLSMYWRNYSRI